VKGAVVYFSFNGSTKRFVENLAKENGFKLYRVEEKKKRSMISAFLKGCRQASKRVEVEIAPIKINWTGIERIIVACPIWAGYPAPAFNSMIKLLPRKMPI